jgi:hypothetical protein
VSSFSYFVAAVILAAGNFVRPAAAQDGAAYPQHTLTKGPLKVTVFLPDATKGYYRGTRFDWSGLVGQAEKDGHTFFGPWKEKHDPTNPEDADAVAEEFGITKPLGYSEAKPGEPFVKIGVGVLEKPEEKNYGFMTRYKIVQAGTWAVDKGDDTIDFRQELKGPRGWAYEYVKRISLIREGYGFTIEHRLKNTGAKAIDTELYCHNFVRFDGQPVGPKYRLRFKFEPTPKRSLKGAAEIKKNELLFTRELKDGEALFTELEGSTRTAEENRLTLEHSEAQLLLMITGDAPVAHFNFFAVRRAACPEPFIDVNLAPGKEMKWKTSYYLITGIGEKK